MIVVRINTPGTSNYMEVAIPHGDQEVEFTIFDDDNNDDLSATMKVAKEDIRHLARYM